MSSNIQDFKDTCPKEELTKVDPEELSVDNEFGSREERRRLERKLVRKLDLRMAILVIIYILNYVDRNNASPRIRHTAQHTLCGIHTNADTLKYALELDRSAIYLPTLLHDDLGNDILPYGYSKKVRMSIYNKSCTSHIANIHSFVGALLTRFFLGFVEAAFFPGALFLLSKWYTRQELGVRTALLFCGSLISNAFGSLIASGILDTMQGRLGHAAWRWLFYIEGALTIFIAFCSIFVLPDFPTTSYRWLSAEEARLAELRMAEDAGVGDESQTETGGRMRGFTTAVTDWKVWWLALSLTSLVVSLSFNAYFPTLTATLGYNTTVTLLLCAPPWGFATLVAFAVTSHSDRTAERFYHIAIPLFVGIIGFIVAISTMNVAARYVSLFLMAQSNAGFITFLAWVSNSIPRPPSKRAVAIAFINAFSQLGNIAGSYVWPTAWGPTYRKSYAICIATNACCIAMCYVFKRHLQSLNKRLANAEGQAQAQKGFRYLV
ncbi:hypothetical protein NM688_g1059 [Phlebia brevispora]|uniref:Uncharacterized protein n=1 Tax=Phlebia brevispora TaxID=194682 RepID=A0ACC1TCG6_9APHY|nr:hypothetical protein NM688_g1059 [Phlebia brevispora]